MIQVLGLVSVVVRDCDEALGFHVGVLGFELIEDTPVPEQDKRWVVVRATNEDQAEHVGCQAGGRVFLFLYTDDFGRDHAAYRDKGVAMKTQYHTASSLDGFIADPDNSLDWLTQFGAVEGTSYPAFIRDVGVVAMGSTTYEWLLRHEIRPDSGDPKPWPYRQPTWVFTSRPHPRIPGADIRFASGDIRPVHREVVAAAVLRRSRVRSRRQCCG